MKSINSSTKAREKRRQKNNITKHRKKYNGEHAIYDGELFHDKPNGKGIMTFDNGDRYEGVLKNALRNGKGMYKYENGDKYEGNWKNGEKSGRGMYTYKNGKRYKGNWKNGHKSRKTTNKP